MKAFHLFVVALLLSTLSCNSQQSTKSNITEPTYSEVPRLYARVNDYSDILTPEQEMELNQLLKSLEDSIGSQLAILAIDTLYGETIEEYSIKVTDNWRLGRADYNDGILITLSKRDRKVRIEVGYGLELIIKDEIAKRIIESTMIPEFRNANFYSGLTKGSQEIINLIYNNPDLVGKEWKLSEKGL